MKMNKAIGILLIIAACVLGYLGVNKVSSSESSVEIVGVELSATDEGGKTTGFIYLGLAAAALIGGITMMGRKH